MAKNADIEEFKEKIARAVWNVLKQDGIRALSVRNISKESQVPVGTIRYYFPKQTDLLIFSMELVEKKLRNRIISLLIENVPNEIVLLEQFLPLDNDRQIEVLVWYSFIGESHNETISSIRRELQNEQAGFFQKWITKNIGIPPDSCKQELYYQALILQSVIDGLCIYYLTDPTEEKQIEIRQVLSNYISKLHDIHLKDRGNNAYG